MSSEESAESSEEDGLTGHRGSIAVGNAQQHTIRQPITTLLGHQVIMLTHLIGYGQKWISRFARRPNFSGKKKTYKGDTRPVLCLGGFSVIQMVTVLSGFKP